MLWFKEVDEGLGRRGILSLDVCRVRERVLGERSFGRTGRRRNSLAQVLLLLRCMKGSWRYVARGGRWNGLLLRPSLS